MANSTITGLVMTLLLGMGIFFLAFGYWTNNITDAGIEIDSKYNTTYVSLQNSTETLNSNVDEIKTAVDNVAEAESTAFAVWNGMKGIGSSIKLFASFITTSLLTYTSIVYPLATDGGVGTLVITLLTIGVITYVVLLVLRALKGEAAV